MKLDQQQLTPSKKQAPFWRTDGKDQPGAAGAAAKAAKNPKDQDDGTESTKSDTEVGEDEQQEFMFGAPKTMMASPRMKGVSPRKLTQVFRPRPDDPDYVLLVYGCDLPATTASENNQYDDLAEDETTKQEQAAAQSYTKALPRTPMLMSDDSDNSDSDDSDSDDSDSDESDSGDSSSCSSSSEESESESGSERGDEAQEHDSVLGMGIAVPHKVRKAEVPAAAVAAVAAAPLSPGRVIIPTIPAAAVAAAPLSPGLLTIPAIFAKADATTANNVFSRKPLVLKKGEKSELELEKNDSVLGMGITVPHLAEVPAEAALSPSAIIPDIIAEADTANEANREHLDIKAGEPVCGRCGHACPYCNQDQRHPVEEEAAEEEPIAEELPSEDEAEEEEEELVEVIEEVEEVEYIEEVIEDEEEEEDFIEEEFVEEDEVMEEEIVEEHYAAEVVEVFDEVVASCDEKKTEGSTDVTASTPPPSPRARAPRAPVDVQDLKHVPVVIERKVFTDKECATCQKTASKTGLPAFRICCRKKCGAHYCSVTCFKTAIETDADPCWVGMKCGFCLMGGRVPVPVYNLTLKNL